MNRKKVIHIVLFILFICSFVGIYFLTKPFFEDSAFLEKIANTTDHEPSHYLSLIARYNGYLIICYYFSFCFFLKEWLDLLLFHEYKANSKKNLIVLSFFTLFQCLFCAIAYWLSNVDFILSNPVLFMSAEFALCSIALDWRMERIPISE